MLEVKNLSKFYDLKGQARVVALDDVSLKFPETGLVFLLGKSGSGKSSMLNAIGGLDAFDKGEIIVKGKSSKTFKEGDFDAYRNTFIGFIFQEYNILDEFTIEKNIALALELQGKKADKAAIESILEQVDLKDFGKRKPNQLSGGQKQRVAIARALVKDPEIIMADEPTGALDSNTGKVVFETLKKLAENRLIIVVSHDRDNAEGYADRIIELRDGKVLSDTTKRKKEIVKVSDKVTESGNTIFIEPNHKVTAKEKAYINKILDGQISSAGVVISMDNTINTNFKKFAKMDSEGRSEYFDETKAADIKEAVTDGNLKLIKSRFKWKDAFKMGASALKFKRITLAFTIILAAIALTMFGVADTAGSYNISKSMHESMKSAGTERFAVVSSKSNFDYMSYFDNLGQEQLDEVKTKFDKNVFVPGYENVDEYYINFYDSPQNVNYYQTDVVQAFAMTNEEYNALGLKLMAGDLPITNNEVAITDYQYQEFLDLGYEEKNGNDLNKIEIKKPEDIIGLELRDYRTNNFKVTITGIINTGFDISRYQALKQKLESTSLANTFLLNDFNTIMASGVYNGLFFAKSKESDLNNSTKPYLSFQTKLTGDNKNDAALIKFLTEFNDNQNGFIIANEFSAFLGGMFGQLLPKLAKGLFWTGFGFAVFAALMLTLFISMTITYKKREIGILRAIGAKRSDVYKIFFNESLLISAINFVLAVALSIVGVVLINHFIGKGISNLTLLSFGIRQIGLLAGVSLLVAAIATALPLLKINRLKPIDAIADRK